MMIKMMEMSQRTRHHEIPKELGMSNHAVQVTQKKYADVRSILDMKMIGSSWKLRLKVSNHKLATHNVMDESSITTEEYQFI